MSRTLAKFVFKKPVLVVLLGLIALPGTVRAQDYADRQKIGRRVAKDWTQVGATQYERGLYKAAEESLLQAQQLQEYLSAGEREKLNELLEKTHLAALERKRISEHIRKADKSAKEGDLITARANLETIRYSSFLTAGEETAIAGKINEIDMLMEEYKRQSAELYERSVELYRTGQLEDAREGFLEVIKRGMLVGTPEITAEEYLMKIDNILIQRLRYSIPTEGKAKESISETTAEGIKDELLSVEPEPAQQPDKTPMGTEQAIDKKDDYVEMVNKKRSILQSYTTAVVNDAVAKAENYIEAGELNNARDVVRSAEQIVNENRQYLGDEMFEQYSSKLKQMSEEILRERIKRSN